MSDHRNRESHEKNPAVEGRTGGTAERLVTRVRPTKAMEMPRLFPIVELIAESETSGSSTKRWKLTLDTTHLM